MSDLDKEFKAHLEFHDFTAGDDLRLAPDLIVATTALNHPGNAVGYRLSWEGSSVCYITDTERPPSGLPKSLSRFVSGTDVLIYDDNFTDKEYRSRVGWGHSTWQAGVRLAKAASVGRLVLFHHDPSHDDATMDRIGQSAAKRFPETVAAAEGMRLHIGGTQRSRPTPPTAGSRRSRVAD